MKRESIDISGFHFTKSPQSKYFILDIQWFLNLFDFTRLLFLDKAV
jgi:hypothetical protein